MKKIYSNIIHFFPVQLFLAHFKRNQFLLFIWIILFGCVTRTLLSKHGGPSLLLAPEYLDTVDIWAFLILGLAVGSFVITFNISSYILNAHHFPFIVTLSRPFYKYSLNNAVIPLIFIIFFIYHSINFQINYEEIELKYAIFNILAFLAGHIIFLFIAFSYFFSTNKDVFKMFGMSRKEFSKKKISKPIKIILDKDFNWKMSNAPPDNVGPWRIETYMASQFRIRKARNFIHYPLLMIQKVLQQNHINVAFFAIGIIIILLVLGIFMDNVYFMIPAAASFILLLTMLILLYSAIQSLLKEWTFTFIIVLLIVINILSKHSFTNYQNSAYGLDYSKNDSLISNLSYNEILEDCRADFDSTLYILNKWKSKNISRQNKRKLPKMVIISTSGGALKSTIWTYYVLAYADSVLNGELLKHTHLITGASGGMIGACYLRELYLLYQQEKISSYYNDTLVSNLSKDILNPMAFSMAVNDCFFRFKKFGYNNFEYYKDRAYAFENKLNKNTDNILDKPLHEYRLPEKESLIPMVIITPTIVNDGRLLLISPQDISYLSINRYYELSKKSDILNVEFNSLYRDFGSENLRFTSALRMNATYPYVSPVVSLPGVPRLYIMDAGIYDNYGITMALKFIYSFREWININTGGIIFIRITEEKPGPKQEKGTLFEQILKPAEKIYGNLLNMQNINNERFIEIAKDRFKTKIDFITLELSREQEKISLSWHLNKKEKAAILNSVHTKNNQAQIKKLKQLLE